MVDADDILVASDQKPRFEDDNNKLGCDGDPQDDDDKQHPKMSNSS